MFIVILVIALVIGIIIHNAGKTEAAAEAKTQAEEEQKTAAEAAAWFQEQISYYQNSPLTQEILHTICDGSGRKPERIEITDEQVTGITDGRPRTYNFQAEGVQKLGYIKFSYESIFQKYINDPFIDELPAREALIFRDAVDQLDDTRDKVYQTWILAYAINHILGDEYHLSCVKLYTSGVSMERKPTKSF